LSWEAWLAVAGICALGAVSPGPSLAVVTAHAGRARSAGLACAWAHAVGIGVHAGLTIAGLAAVLAAHPVLYRAIALVGAGYLAWLGVRALRAKRSVGDVGGMAAYASSAAGVRDGFTIALLNPKIAVFFLALFSQFVEPAAGLATVAVLWTTAVVIDGGWYSAVALVLSGRPFQDWLDTHATAFDRITGCVLLALAAWALTQQVATLA
jgi:threonine/homoserine/homoserine lactone efflux protein